MDKIYLSGQNFNQVSKSIYHEVQKKWGYNVAGKYDNDIKNAMIKLWDKNKEKAARIDKKKNTQRAGEFITAMNDRIVSVVIPQIGNSLVSGATNNANNNLFEEPQYYGLHGQLGNPIEPVKDAMPEQVKNYTPSDTDKAYERMLNDRNYMGNVYSVSNYQQKPETYDNHLQAPPPEGNNLRSQGAGAYPVPNRGSGAPIIEESRVQEKRNEEIYKKEAPMVLPPQTKEADPATYNNGFSYETHTVQLIDDELRKREEKMRAEHKAKIGDANVNLAPSASANRSGSSSASANRSSSGNVENFVTKPKNTTNRVDDVFKDQRQIFVPQKPVPENYEEELRRQTIYPINKAVSDEPAMSERKVVEETKQLEKHELETINLMSDNAYLDYPLIPPQIPNYMKRPYFLVVDSLQRDFITYPSSTYFQVKFEQPEMAITVPQRLLPNGTVQWGPAFEVEYAGGKGAKLENIYKNLLTLRCLDCQLPLENVYVGGSAPYKFNGPRIDVNTEESPNQFRSYPYGPIFRDDYGIPLDVLDEPYYFLVVKELDGAYDATSFAGQRALAKLTYDKMFGVGRRFINLKTSGNEYKYWHPTQLGSLSQMTLALVNRFNTLVNLGQDRIVIESIEEGDENTGQYCDLPVGSHLTKVKVILNDPSYQEPICSSGNIPGDKLLFYTVFSCNPLSEQQRLPPEIHLDTTNFPVCKLLIENGGQVAEIDALRFMKVGDLLVLDGTYVLEVVKFFTNNETYQAFKFEVVSKTAGFDPTVMYKRVVYVRKSPNGFQAESKNQFNYHGGMRVVKVDDQTTFQVLYPYECLPDFMKSAPDGFYSSGEMFYIQTKKQITYTFEVVAIEANSNPIMSRIQSA